MYGMRQQVIMQGPACPPLSLPGIERTTAGAIAACVGCKLQPNKRPSSRILKLSITRRSSALTVLSGMHTGERGVRGAQEGPQRVAQLHDAQPYEPAHHRAQRALQRHLTRTTHTVSEEQLHEPATTESPGWCLRLSHSARVSAARGRRSICSSGAGRHACEVLPSTGLPTFTMVIAAHFAPCSHCRAYRSSMPAVPACKSQPGKGLSKQGAGGTARNSFTQYHTRCRAAAGRARTMQK